jgi:hypothetical protein
MSTLGYEVGDKVFIFQRHNLVQATVTKITPSGQVTATSANGFPYRFTPRGNELGSGAWGYTHIRKKSEQDAQAKLVQREVSERTERNMFRTECQSLSGRNPANDRDSIVADLRKLADLIANGGTA